MIDIFIYLHYRGFTYAFAKMPQQPCHSVAHSQSVSHRHCLALLQQATNAMLHPSKQQRRHSPRYYYRFDITYDKRSNNANTSILIIYFINTCVFTARLATMIILLRETTLELIYENYYIIYSQFLKKRAQKRRHATPIPRRCLVSRRQKWQFCSLLAPYYL